LCYNEDGSNCTSSRKIAEWQAFFTPSVGVCAHSRTFRVAAKCELALPGAGCRWRLKPSRKTIKQGGSLMVTPYITFNGKCNEAMSFYKSVFNAEIKSAIPYGDYIPNGIKSPPEHLSDFIMHGEMKICETDFWFADEVQPVSCGDMLKLTASVPSANVGQEYFDKLKADGKITLPPTETYYSNFHAAVVDKYGVNWNIVSTEPPNQ